MTVKDSAVACVLHLHFFLFFPAFLLLGLSEADSAAADFAECACLCRSINTPIAAPKKAPAARNILLFSMFIYVFVRVDSERPPAGSTFFPSKQPRKEEWLPRGETSEEVFAPCEFRFRFLVDSERPPSGGTFFVENPIQP